MDIQKQVAFEKFHAHECNCDYEDLKRRLDRYEMLTGHRYPLTSPRHEAWLTWCAAWDAKVNTVPEGFVLVPKELSMDDARKHAEMMFNKVEQMARHEHRDLNETEFEAFKNRWLEARTLTIQHDWNAMIEAQEQGHG